MMRQRTKRKKKIEQAPYFFIKQKKTNKLKPAT
jgi:hypothetical protein